MVKWGIKIISEGIQLPHNSMRKYIQTFDKQAHGLNFGKLFKDWKLYRIWNMWISFYKFRSIYTGFVAMLTAITLLRQFEVHRAEIILSDKKNIGMNLAMTNHILWPLINPCTWYFKQKRDQWLFEYKKMLVLFSPTFKIIYGS